MEQYLDREIGLHYNTFRFYDPDVGRFTTPDPIELQGGLNLYLYGENPFTSLDPLGWAPTPLNKPGFMYMGSMHPMLKPRITLAIRSRLHRHVKVSTPGPPVWAMAS